MPGFDKNFAFLQHDQPALLIEPHIHRTVGVQIQHSAVRQTHGALLTGRGALIGEPVIQRQKAFAGEQPHTDQHHNAGQPTAQSAHPAANAFA
ncbi:hypothetical protein D3C81_1331700 [compost metagenome]